MKMKYLMLLLLLPIANAAFYSDVTISAMHGYADLESGFAEANFTLSSAKPAAFTSSLLNMPGAVTNETGIITMQGTKEISIRFAAAASGNGLLRYAYNPQLLFNGMRNGNKIRSYSLKIIMPSGVDKLVSISEQSVESYENGRKALYWQKSDIYPEQISISWSSVAANISVQRVIPDKIEGEFDITTTITNSGNDLQNISMQDSYLSTQFEPADNESQVVIEGNNIRVVWKKEIALLRSGETKSFSYRLRALNTTGIYVFEPTRVTVNGALVAVSEKQERSNPLYFEPTVPIRRINETAAGEAGQSLAGATAGAAELEPMLPGGFQPAAPEERPEWLPGSISNDVRNILIAAVLFGVAIAYLYYHTKKRRARASQ